MASLPPVRAGVLLRFGDTTFPKPEHLPGACGYISLTCREFTRMIVPAPKAYVDRLEGARFSAEITVVEKCVRKPLSSALLLLPAVFLICGHVLAQQAIPKNFFGLHVNQAKSPSFPVQLMAYGNVRNWDVIGGAWPDIQGALCTPTNCTNIFDFTVVDNLLSLVYQDNQTNRTNNVVEFTLARTSVWAQPSKPVACGTGTDTESMGKPYPGSCYPPYDLNPDGTGANQIWRNWVFHIASHVNAPGYTNTHAPIKYWEIWNEFDGQAGTFWAGGLSGTTNGTTNQLVRMTEDANCIITGRTQTITATGETCAQVLQTLMPVAQTQSVDPTAKIVQPSITAPDAGPLQCFLYCKPGCASFDDHDQCTVKNAGANAVDIIDFHYYATRGNPEDLSTLSLRNALQPQELSKPLWVGEGSFGNTFSGTDQSAWWQDPYTQGGFIARYFATIWSQTLPYGSAPCDWSSQVCQQALWYGYDFDKKIAANEKKGSTGALFCAGTDNTGTICNDGGVNHNTVGLLYPPKGPAPMWNVAVGWLTDAVPAASGGNAFCNPLTQNSTVWHCDFKKGNTPYSMVWDNSYSSSAKTHATYCTDNFPSNPYVCGNTPYTVSPQYTRWIDLSGTVRNVYGVPFVVGLNPVLLEP